MVEKEYERGVTITTMGVGEGFEDELLSEMARRGRGGFHYLSNPSDIPAAFGRELDGAEGVHLLEGDPGTDVDPAIGMRPDDYFIRKRRYSCFFGTEFEILLRGLRADTLVLVGGHTDVCVHYTFVDAHQHDYFCRVVEDCVAGSSQAAHDAALNAMEYLQTGARRTSAEVIEAFRAPAVP